MSEPSGAHSKVLSCQGLMPWAGASPLETTLPPHSSEAAKGRARIYY